MTATPPDAPGVVPRQRSSRALPGLLGAVLAVLLLGYCGLGPPGNAACGAMTGYSPEILEPIGQCPTAAARLGTPVRFGLIGAGCTNYESGEEAGAGQAYGTAPISGPNGSATYDYQASKSGDHWVLSRGLVTFGDGSKVDIVACIGPQGVARMGNRALLSTLRNGCDADDASICFALGNALANGTYEPANPSAAKAAFDHACRLGHAAACASRDAL